jgi:hypothetical protein
MKQAIGAFLFLVPLTIAIQARGTSLPDSCGDDKVQFDVQTEKHPPAPVPPQEGKAQIVFIETMDKNLGCWSCGAPTSRYGLDGSWVGASQGNSYFTLDVAPGEHHLCMDWQSAFGRLRQKIGMAEFTAEAGKTYYFEAKVKLKEYSGGENSAGDIDRDLNFVQVSDDEGKFRLKASALAAAKERK